MTGPTWPTKWWQIFLTIVLVIIALTAGGMAIPAIITILAAILAALAVFFNA